MLFFRRKSSRKHGIMLDNSVDESRCSGCDGACCRGFVSVELSEDEYVQLQRMGAQRLEYNLREKYFLIIENGCEFLVENRCGIYDYRPDVCRRFTCVEGDDDKSHRRQA